MPDWQDSTIPNGNLTDEAKAIRDEKGLSAALPPGGTSGQVVKKNSSGVGDASWATLSSTDVGLGNVTNDAQVKASQIDTDGTLTANSDASIASQKAAKTYTDARAVPTGGATGQVLQKNSSTDRDVSWITPPSAVPTGGATGTVLTKNSSANGDASWIAPNASNLPNGGTTGQVLAKNSATNGDAGWITSPGGTFGTQRSVSANTTATSSDYAILVDATSAARTVTLPAAASNTGLTLLIRKTDSTTNHSVTITPNASETIDGVTGSLVLSRQFGTAVITSDGVGWQRVGIVSPRPAVGNFYVDTTNGNDSWPGTSPFLPKKTIGSAISGLSNATIYVGAGTYSETVALTSSQQYLRFVAVPGGTAGPAGTVIKAPSTTTSALTMNGAQNIIWDGFAFYGRNDGTYNGTLCDLTGGVQNIFQNCTFSGEFSGFGATTKQSVGEGTLGGIGIHVYNCERYTFRDCLVQGNHIGIKCGTGTGNMARCRFENIWYGSNWINYQEASGDTSGGFTCNNWKVQNTFALTFAIAHISTNGSNPADGDTVTVRDKTYRFKNTMAAANDIKIGANIDATLLSLVHAVNGTGTVGTDYFTGTTKPTSVQAGYVNLVDYGLSGGNGFFLDVTDTTNHACTFQLTDIIGPGGNGTTFAVSSANLTDYLGLGAFGRAGWGAEFQFDQGRYISLDLMENISLPAGCCVLIAGNQNDFSHLAVAPQTQVSVTGNDNVFDRPSLLNIVTVQSGASRNWFTKPYNGGVATSPSGSRIIDNGTGTVVTLT